jgi:hypothetical protein
MAISLERSKNWVEFSLGTHRMPDHLLTFELTKDGDELFIHADAAGLR